MTDYDLGTHKRGDSLTFEVDLTVTVEGSPVTDLSTWSPVCQFRPKPNTKAEVYQPTLLGVTGTVCSFGIPNALSATMHGDFVGEVQLTDPNADEGYGDITFPGDDGYILLTVAADVVRVTA